MASFVTDSGLAAFVSAVVTADVLKSLGWGSGTGAVNSATDLVTPLPEARVAGALSVITVNTTNDTYQNVGQIVATAPRTVAEVGVFDGLGSGSPPSGDVMGIYGDFAGISLGNGDSITFTVRATLEQQ